METKKFKVQKAERTKGGFDNTRTVLTGAGITAIGGAAAGASYAAIVNAAREKEKPVNEPNEEEGQVTQTTVEATEEQPSQSQQPPSREEQPSNEYQPTDNGQSSNSGQSATNNNGSPNTSEEEISPEDVAQMLADEIDKADIDDQNELTIEEFGMIYGPDGTEMGVAVVHAQDGTQYLLADIDGDGLYNEVFDLSGNYIGMAEGNLTASDLEFMQNPTGGYLAMGEERVGDDPTQGITDTGGGRPVDDKPEMAQQEIPAETNVDEEEISDEELLAILIGGETEEKGDDEGMLVEWEPEDIESEGNTEDELGGGIEDGYEA